MAISKINFNFKVLLNISLFITMDFLLLLNFAIGFLLLLSLKLIFAIDSLYLRTQSLKGLTDEVN